MVQRSAKSVGEKIMQLTYLEAIRQGIWEEMDLDPSVFCLGEDIGIYGGAFKVTDGFIDRFGPERVIDTPIAESAIVGAAFANEICFADGDDVIFGGDFAFDAAVEIFVLEEDAGIVVADGGFDEALGVVGRGGADYFEAGIVDEPHFGILRVERAAVNVSAAGPPQDEWSRRAPEILSLIHI